MRMTINGIKAPKRMTTTDQAFAAILDAVLDGTIPPGTHLTLQALADQLGTSLQPVREAIRQLEATGLIEVEPHRGARVQLLTDGDFEDTYRTRLAIEGLLIERAALCFDPDDEHRARGALQRWTTALERNEHAQAREAHQEFHFALYDAARSPWLIRSMQPTWHNAERYRLLSTVTLALVDQRNREHIDILEACIAHDPGAARQALNHHLLESATRYNARIGSRLSAETQRAGTRMVDVPNETGSSSH